MGEMREVRSLLVSVDLKRKTFMGEMSSKEAETLRKPQWYQGRAWDWTQPHLHRTLWD